MLLLVLTHRRDLRLGVVDVEGIEVSPPLLKTRLDVVDVKDVADLAGDRRIPKDPKFRARARLWQPSLRSRSLRGTDRRLRAPNKPTYCWYSFTSAPVCHGTALPKPPKGLGLVCHLK